MLAPEIFRGQSLLPLKSAVEVGNAGEPAGDGNIGDGGLGIDQQPGSVSQPDIIEEVDEIDAGLGLEKATESGLSHTHQFCCFRQPDGPAEIGIHKIDQLFHPAAVHVDIVGIVVLFSRKGPRAGSLGQLVEDGHQFQHGVEACLQLQRFELGGYVLDRFVGEEDAFQGLLEQVADGAQLRPFQEDLMEKVLVELDGDLEDLFALAFMGEPGMGDIRTDQHQLQVLDLFHAVSHDPFDAPGVLYEIQLIFLMVMHRKVKLRFIPGEQRETIRLC